MAAQKRSVKVSVTKNYRLFKRDSGENRPFNLKKHKKLKESMMENGFLHCFPIACYRDKDKHLVVKDGQHRLALAEELGLPVYWIEDDTDFDIAKVNSTPVPWRPVDFAMKFAAQGKTPYREGLEFCESHKLPIGTGFCLLGGVTNFSNISNAFYGGEFVVKDRRWADDVASVYGPLTRMSQAVRNARFVAACMAACRVSEFDTRRLVQNAARCRDKLVSYSTREAYLDMLEEIYNFGRKSLLGLKAAATMAMRERCVTNGKGEAKR